MTFELDQFASVLTEALGEDCVLRDEPMSAHTTFEIGGPADILVSPSSAEKLVEVLNLCKQYSVDYFVMGNGSDLLVSDKGIRGVVILLADNFSEIEVDGSCVTAQAGAQLRDVALAAGAAGFSGFEPLWGIPATVGGACFMNAGAYGGEISFILKSLRAWDPAVSALREYGIDELAMGYRTSRIRTEGLVVIDATFELQPADPTAIQEVMQDFKQRREDKQPLEMPSAGSTFKRPEGYFAGKLIMDAGLRGCSIGGAQVSTKHCGFVVNKGGATAKDVDNLIHHIQDEVKRQFGVELECEVRHIGEF